MIALKFCFSWRSACLTSRLQHLLSTISKNDLSPNAQKSVLATAIIEQIVSSKLLQSFHDLSLRERILKLNPLINNREISQQIKNEVFQPFTQGVTLNYKVYSQPKKNWQEQKESSKPFIFFPSFITTRKIFELLIKTSAIDLQKRKIDESLTGGIGMGKTASIALYIQISHYIHHFYQQTQVNQQRKLELQDLIQKDLVKLVPRCWYWCADAQKYTSKEQQITNLIFEQTTDLPLQKRRILQDNLKDPDQFKYRFLKMYPESIHNKVILDQMHNLSQLKSEFEKVSEAKGFYRGKQNYEQLLSQSELKLDSDLKMLKAHLDELQVFKDQFTFIGSPHTTDLYRGDRQYHSYPQKITLKPKQATIDFLQHLWFQIQTKLKSKGLQPFQINQVKKEFFEECTQKNVSSKPQYNFLSIQTSLKDNSALNLISKQSMKDNILQAINSLKQQMCTQIATEVK